MKRTRGIALSGVFSALATALMWAGAISGLGTYASPILAGIALIPVGLSLGRKYHALAFCAVALLSALINPEWEQNLLFTALFGWYPIVKPLLDRLKKPWNTISKFALFNAATVGVELLVMLVLIPEAEEWWLLAGLLLMGNLTFFVYDITLPRISYALSLKLDISRR